VHKRLLLAAVFLLLSLAACSGNQCPDESADNNKSVELMISAASSLKDVLDVIGHTYQEEHPKVKLKYNFGGSGSLQKQISQGAPVDLFFSAAEDKFDLLVEQGLISGDDRADLLGNELILIIPKNESSLSIAGFSDLKKEEIEKVSIGTPESVPAGKYAKESLESLGVWKDVETKMVYAKDVRQVLSYVETGNVDAGVVYRTDALSSDKVHIAAAADPNTHSPIIYPVGIIKDSKQYEAAKDFYSYLQSDAALKVFEDYGFTVE
jgi:molybdate transport system substrate-binding protein